MEKHLNSGFRIWNHGLGTGLQLKIYQTLLKVYLISFYLNMVFFLSLSTWNYLRHLSETQGYSGLVSEPCTPTQTLKKFWGDWLIRFRDILEPKNGLNRFGFDSYRDLGLGTFDQSCQLVDVSVNVLRFMT